MFADHRGLVQSCSDGCNWRDCAELQHGDEDSYCEFYDDGYGYGWGHGTVAGHETVVGNAASRSECLGFVAPQFCGFSRALDELFR